MLPAIGRVIEAIRRIYPGAHEVLCQLLAKAAVVSDRLMVSVEASTGTGTARSWMTGRAQSRITGVVAAQRSEEHTSELQSLMRISYAVFCLKKKIIRILLIDLVIIVTI